MTAQLHPPAEERYVFLSYDRKHDREEASRLRQDLVAAGVRVWWDGDVLPGQTRAHERRQALANASAVVLCWSVSAVTLERSAVNEDARTAIALQRQMGPGKVFLVPVRLSPCDVPKFDVDATLALDGIGTADLFPVQKRRAGVGLLVKALRHVLSRPASGGVKGPPRPRFDDEALQQHSRELTALYDTRRASILAGKDTRNVDRSIREMKRKHRRGPTLSPGDRLLGGRFELVEMLGRGGFGTVWKAWDEENGDCLALKVLSADYLDDRSRVDRFLRGARWMSKLQHENIVRVIEPDLVDEDDGWRFFSMELVSGPNLEDAILKKILPPEEGLRVIYETARALRHAHEESVIHRDVKPSNVLLTKDFHVKLTDFDLVRAESTETPYTKTAQAMGTFIYAAPELTESAKDANAAADVYSLARTATFVLRGEQLPSPYVEKPEELIRSLDTTQELKDVLARSTAIDATQRPPNAAAFLVNFVRATQDSLLTREALVLAADSGTPAAWDAKSLALHVRRRPGDTEILIHLTEAGKVSHNWVVELMHDRAEPLPEALLRVTEHLVTCPEHWPQWSPHHIAIFSRLLRLAPATGRASALLRQVRSLLDDLSFFKERVRIAEAMMRSKDKDQRLVDGTLTIIAGLQSSELQAFVLDRTLASSQGSLPIELLNDRDWPWLSAHAERLLQGPAIGVLKTARLLSLAENATLSSDDQQRLAEELDKRMAYDLHATTKVLVLTGWWPFWRRQSSLEEPSAAGLAWLCCPVWQDSEPPEATYETWQQVVDDIGRISVDQMSGLYEDGHRRWPAVPPFEKEQFADLARVASDLDALNLVVNGAVHEEWFQAIQSGPTPGVGTSWTNDIAGIIGAEEPRSIKDVQPEIEPKQEEEQKAIFSPAFRALVALLTCSVALIVMGWSIAMPNTMGTRSEYTPLVKKLKLTYELWLESRMSKKNLLEDTPKNSSDALGGAPAESTETENASSPETTPTTATSDPELTFQQIFLRLTETLASLPASNPAAMLYQSHFKRAPENNDLNGNETMGWGFVKLFWLYKMGAVGVPNTNISRANLDNTLIATKSRSVARLMLEHLMPGLSDREISALVVVTCQAFDHGQPGLPGDPQDRDSVPRAVNIARDCTFDRTELQHATDILWAMNEHFANMATSQGGG